MLFYLKKGGVLALIFFSLMGMLACGDGDSGGGSPVAATDEDVDSNNTDTDSLVTGEGIIDPIELSGGQAGSAVPNTATFDMNDSSLTSASNPILLQSLTTISQDVLNGVPVTLSSDSDTYNPTEAATKVVAYIEKQAIYTSFRASASGTVVTLQSPINVPAIYRDKSLVWSFLHGPSSSENTFARIMRNGIGGPSFFYSNATITLHANLPANADDHEITIDDVTIDLGTEALTREEIAQKIADTDFSSGGDYTSTGAYYVGPSGPSLLFQRRDADTSLNGSIPIQDNSYTGANLPE